MLQSTAQHVRSQHRGCSTAGHSHSLGSDVTGSNGSSRGREQKAKGIEGKGNRRERDIRNQAQRKQKAKGGQKKKKFDKLIKRRGRQEKGTE